MRIHHRNYAFRPPYHEKESARGPGRLLFRFSRVYLAPFKRMLLACILMGLLDYCGSFYLLAFYSKVVIDSILVIRPPGPAPAERPARGEKSPAGLERERASRRPERIFAETSAEKEHFPPRPPGARGKLLGMFLLYVGTMLGGNLLNRRAARLRIRIGQGFGNKLREDMHAQVMRLSVAYHARHTPGRLLARIISDTAALQEYVLSIFINGAAQLAIVLVGIGMLLMINWPMLVMVALALPFYVLIYRAANPLLMKLQREGSHTNACLWGLVSQKIDAIRLIQACNREKRERLYFHRLAACALRDALLQNRLAAATQSLATIISGLASGGAVFLYGIRQVLNNSISLGEMMYAWGTACALFGPILELSNLNATYVNLLVYVRRLADVLDEPVKIVDAPGAVDFPAPLKRGLVLSQLRFGYDPANTPVLKDISLMIPAGQWVCIMGPSGCGKTTLLHLIDRLFAPDAGAILFDDVAVQNIRLASLRRQVVLVPQEAQIISGTVRDNICYGWPAAEPARIIAAARAAELHDFVMQLPAKYETMLGEKGATLSGGQKQRLSLARALLTSPEVLLLDDCTSALDAETERHIQETLTKIMAGKTALIVSQRVSMARRCRRICVLENGLITEAGPPAELLAQGGFYARLYAKQTE